MRPDPELRPDSLMQKIRSARQSDASFRRAHRTVQIIMASWAVIQLSRSETSLICSAVLPVLPARI